MVKQSSLITANSQRTNGRQANTNYLQLVLKKHIPTPAVTSFQNKTNLFSKKVASSFGITAQKSTFALAFEKGGGWIIGRKKRKSTFSLLLRSFNHSTI